MKTVFSNAQCAHVWAQQKQSSGRSGNGNLYFRDRAIFSYRDSWPLALFTGRKTSDGRDIVLVNSDSYSNSTGKHLSDVRGALHGLPVEEFSGPREMLLTALRWGDSEERIDAALDFYIAHKSRLEREAWEGYANPRKAFRDYHELPSGAWGRPPVTAEELADRVAAISLDDFRATAAMLGRPMPAGLDDSTVKAAREKVKANFADYFSEKKVAAREKARVKRELAAFRTNQAHAIEAGTNAYFATLYPEASNVLYSRRFGAKNALTVAEWQAGKAGRLPYNGGPDLVRRKGNRLETSRGAEAPWAHAVAIFLKAQDCRALSRGWHRNGETMRAGHFELDSIDASGNIHIGCHFIEFTEMLRLAVLEVPHLVKATAPLPAVLAA